MSTQPSTAGFLGTGWSFPPRFSQGGAEVQTVSGVHDIHESLQILVNTSLGERIMHEDFGCSLQDHVFAEVNAALVSQIRGLLKSAILRHEPRVELMAVEVGEDTLSQGLLQISLDYIVRASNSRFNMVFPFYVNEASASVG